MSSPPAAIEARGLHKSYRLGRTTLHVLRGVSVHVAPGEFVAVVGASGSGKSTLLHLLGLLDRPSRGAVLPHGADAAGLASKQRNLMRCRDIGFVFQFYHLLPELNVLDNVLLPARVDTSILRWASRRSARRAEAIEVLRRVGLTERLKHRPKELSGGERQRVAIGRAIVREPSAFLFDEPLSNLDAALRVGMGACGGKTCTELVMRIFRELGVDLKDVEVNVERPFTQEIPIKSFLNDGDNK